MPRPPRPSGGAREWRGARGVPANERVGESEGQRPSEGEVERHDYRPFGEDNQSLPAPGTDPARFLGQPRDETKLDYFGARYYAMTNGRFTSVDPVMNPAALVLPQKWNRYAYARNNPLRFTDPSGLDDGELLVATGGGCAECHLFDNWANSYLLQQWAYSEQQRTGGAGGPRVSTQTTATMPDGRVVDVKWDPLHQLFIDIANGTKGTEGLVQSIIMIWGTAFGGAAAALGDCLAGGGCHLEDAVARVPGLSSVLSRAATALGVVGKGATRATIHGAERLAQAGFTDDLVKLLRSEGQVLRQADGATVYLRQRSPGRFDFIVEGERGVVTAHKNMPQKAIDGLAKRYGWK